MGTIAILILYDTRGGQTEKVARRIAGVVQNSGGEADVENVRERPADIDAGHVDAVIIGSPIYATKHSKHLIRFIKRNLATLSSKPSYFFSVSLSAAGKTDEQQQDAQRCVQNFLRSTNWEPQRSKTFAGALLYQDYSWFIRWIMKRISKKAGGDTDTSRNYEYTDWDAVEAFARQCLEEAGTAKEVELKTA